MKLLRGRVELLVATAALFAGGTFGVACSGPGDGGPDTGTDGTLLGDGGGNDGQGNEGGTPQTCEAGVSGTCDVYLQNCPTGQDCEVAPADGGNTLTCVTNKNGTPEGYACTGNSYGNQCVAGTLCVGGRCSKPCCNDSACGTAKPEGFQGKCSLQFAFKPDAFDFMLCTYSKPCEPFQLQPCGPGLGCNVDDGNGTSTCSGYANGTNTGLAEHQPCQFKNDCDDGMGCFGALDGGTSTCQWDCYNKGRGGPYDNQIAADAGAGYGGCPSGETCKLITWAGGALPNWLGFCAK